MSKGLEALKENNILYHKYTIHQVYGETIKADNVEKQINENNNVIEKELKEYEETKAELKQVMNDYQDLGQYIYKIKEALKNNLKCNIIFGSNDEEWALFVERENKRIEIASGNDKKQYELLKEVLYEKNNY